MDSAVGRRASALASVLLLTASLAAAQATRTWVSGVGDDANPCSRTAPCKTLAGAISKTAAGGVINILDPAGVGAVTITKSISIEGDGTLAGVLASGTNGIVVNAGPNDVVVLRGLTVEGLGTGLNGVSFLAGAALHVENCTINNFSQKGIDFKPGGASLLFIKDTVIRNSSGAAGGGVIIRPTGGGLAQATLDHVRLQKNRVGLQVEANASAVVTRSEISGSANLGILALSSTGLAELLVEDSFVVGNGAAGIRSDGASALVRVGRTAIVNNLVGFKINASGRILSFGDNHVAGNSTDGAPTGTISPI